PTANFAPTEMTQPAGEELSNESNMVQPTVRSQFADTAFWTASLMTDNNGVAIVEFNMPENLTAWKMKTWAMGHGTVVGEGACEAMTAKNLVLRLQAPRFFVEKDEVVLSANIHNYLEKTKTVRVILELDGNCAQPMTDTTIEMRIADKGEKRVDWRVKILREGEITVRMKALTDEESDAMEMRFPVYVHGMLKTDSFCGIIRPDQTSASVAVTVPKERRVEESRLELRYSPTLAGAMIDALPYLVEYPYGCTEQTLNRFLPIVITQKILKNMGIDLAAVQQKRVNLNSQETGDDVKRAEQWKRWNRNPVFDSDTVEDMVKQGLKQLSVMQLSDGGWGWFSGWGEHSYPHTTAYVVHGLQIAGQNGVTVAPDILSGGIRWLENYQSAELEKLKNAVGEIRPWKSHADNLDAFIYMVLADAGQENSAMREFLYRDRNYLAIYGKAMFGMALYKENRQEELAMIVRNIEQFLVRDNENQTAWLNLQNENYWWYWYGSEYEAHAYYLKLLSLTNPKSEKAAGLVKYLLNNRKHATCWNSTRDTAICIEALADYLHASGEDKPDMTVEIMVDGAKKKEARITSENLFTFDNKLTLTGRAVESGTHKIELCRKGKGPVYFNVYLSNFTLEDHITKAGMEIKVERKYYKLEPVDKTVNAAGFRGQVLEQKAEKYKRKELQNMSLLKSGDLVEIELEIESKNDYEYIVFEDMKAAGFEPIETRSGYNGNDIGAYMELRDEQICFFVRSLDRGRHSVSYRMRAEIPGKFSALPAKAHAMYAPELKANSSEIKLAITD
ncbi:MAG: alpha-2-macroglobulin, partial [Lentisphaerae bacterium]|nr:alpha-2-macroglobulin [Lentisphaerota bacterium]